MALNMTKQPLSGSSDGKPILIEDTLPGSAQTIHTADSVAGNVDELCLSVISQHESSVTLTLMLGDTVSPNSRCEMTIPAQGVAGQDGPIPIFRPGEMVLSGGAVVKAFASVADVLSIVGSVTRIKNS